MAVTKRKRAYRKAARAESEAETRARIVEAVMALHEEVGPLRTSISGIAERAGVQRLTVYRHFPGEPELIGACSALWTERNPMPELPGASARERLIALYAWYRRGERMLEKVIEDAKEMPVVDAQLDSLRDYLERLVADLEREWRGRSQRRRVTLRHAVQFATWQSLARLTGSDAEAAELVLGWCEG